VVKKNMKSFIGVRISQEVHMRRFLFPLLLFFLLGVLSPIASFAETNRSVTILYTGFVTGNVDPCAA
jgi:hypothetical protein